MSCFSTSPDFSGGCSSKWLCSSIPEFGNYKSSPTSLAPLVALVNIVGNPINVIRAYTGKLLCARMFSFEPSLSNGFLNFFWAGFFLRNCYNWLGVCPPQQYRRHIHIPGSCSKSRNSQVMLIALCDSEFSEITITNNNNNNNNK